MARALFWLSLVLCAARVEAAAVAGEICGTLPATRNCSATQDVFLVIDNSYSVSGRHADITEFMKRFIDQYELTPGDPLSPRVGIITFASCVGCSEAQSAQVVYPMSDDKAVLKAAADSRDEPSSQMPMTCISCALNLANTLFFEPSFYRADAQPIVFVLTDGEQSVLGGDEAAVRAADTLRGNGIDITTLQLGDGNAYTMGSMASRPPDTYAIAASTVDELISQTEDIVVTFCTQAVYACRLTDSCRDPLQIAIHGSGFIERLFIESGGGGAAALLSCRITGVGNAPDPGTVVAATFIDAGTLTCATDAIELPYEERAPSAVLSVEVTVDGGEYYHNVNTDEVSWEKPYQLQTPEERQTDTSDCVWLPSDQQGGWVPAYVLSRAANNRVRVRPVQGGGKEVDVPTGGKGAQALYPLKLSSMVKVAVLARPQLATTGSSDCV